MAKPKIALYWCSGCGGCEESVVDLAEDILKVVEAVDIVFWPVAMDFKYSDLEALADGELAAALINGAVRLSEQERIAKLLRKKAQVVIAHGTCAHLGGVVGLGNFYTRESLINRAFKEVPTVVNPDNKEPQTSSLVDGTELKLTAFYKNVKPLNKVIDVDYYLPGCPPTPELLKAAVFALLSGDLPPKGSVLAEKKALCDSCSRRDSKPERIRIKEFKRVYQVHADQNRCFLDQGIICMGLATRGGCKERCLKANMPCRGCFGPLDDVVDQGAKIVSCLAGMLDSNDAEEIKRIIKTIPDPSGLFYRYNLAASQLSGKALGQEEK